MKAKNSADERYFPDSQCERKGNKTRSTINYYQTESMTPKLDKKRMGLRSRNFTNSNSSWISKRDNFHDDDSYDSQRKPIFRTLSRNPERPNTSLYPHRFGAVSYYILLVLVCYSLIFI